jgi:hypothetical protein
MELASIQTGLESAKATYDSLVKDATGPLRKALSEEVARLGIDGIVWTQYTPHFNDGEPCEFNVNSPTVIFAGIENVDNPYDHPFGLECWGNWDQIQDPTVVYYAPRELLSDYDVDEDKFKEIMQFAEFIQKQEDLMRATFGDGFFIKVSANSVEVIDYDHD